MDSGQDNGQATMFAALALGVMAVLVLGIGAAGRVLVDRAQARTAADASALAGAASGGRGAAERLAAANGSRVVDYRTDGDEVVVKVARGRTSAFARARFVPRPVTWGPGLPGNLPRGGAGMRSGLVVPLVAALARADRMLGTPVPIASGLRTRAQQQSLWDRRGSNPYPVARPGTSHHERGLAVDVPRWFVPRLLTVAARAGLCQPMPVSDPVHFELCP